jgi:hypothetical protein
MKLTRGNKCYYYQHRVSLCGYYTFKIQKTDGLWRLYDTSTGIGEYTISDEVSGKSTLAELKLALSDLMNTEKYQYKCA